MCPHVQRGLLSVLIIKLIMKIDFYSIFPLPTTKCFNRFLKVSSILLITSLPTIINRRCNIEIEIEIEIEIINQIRAPGGHIQITIMIDIQQQYIKLNIHGEVSIIVVQAHSGRKRGMHINVHTHTHIYIMMKSEKKE